MWQKDYVRIIGDWSERVWVTVGLPPFLSTPRDDCDIIINGMSE